MCLELIICSSIVSKVRCVEYCRAVLKMLVAVVARDPGGVLANASQVESGCSRSECEY